MTDHLTLSESMKVIHEVFNPDVAQYRLEQALKFIEQNLSKVPNLLHSLIEYYFNNDDTKQLKIIIDLLSKLPDDLVTKLFDKLNEYLKNQLKLEKLLTLLFHIAFKQKAKWLQKLISHPLLFTNLIRTLTNRSNTPNNLSDSLIIQSCLLFVLLMTTMPLQLPNQLQEMFQIIFNSFKIVTTAELTKRNSELYLAFKPVKWSIRLFFYVFYGLYPNYFIQYIRKKENLSLNNKDALNQILLQLRMHPMLLKEKADSVQNRSIEDASLEWRQYCLDTAYTNFSMVFNDICQSSNVTPGHFNSTSCLGTVTNSGQLSVNLTTKSSANLYGSNASIPPLSPSIIKSFDLPFEKQRTQSTITPRQTPTSELPPTTPSQYEQQKSRSSKVFQFPSIESLTHVPSIGSELDAEANVDPSENSRNLKPIKNLTAQFMSGNDETQAYNQPQKQPTNIEAASMRKIESKPQANVRFSCFGTANFFLDSNKLEQLGQQQSGKTANSGLKKSLSDTNLNRHSAPLNVKQTANSRLDGEQPAPITQTSRNQSNRKLIQSEMRDTNIISGSSGVGSMDHQSLTPSSSLFQSPYGISFTSTTSGFSSNHHQFSSMYASNSAIFQNKNDSLESTRSIEPAEIIKAYLTSNTDHSESMLKREYDNLLCQLMYEKCLREKYEEQANRLYFYKIERDQLFNEKIYLEKYIKETIDKYRKEFEDYFNSTTRAELNSCRKEIEDKNKLIEMFQQKQIDLEIQLSEVKEKFDEYKTNYKLLEKKCNLTEQDLVREQNRNKYHQNEANYIRTLRLTADNLRKKLVIMTKLQSKLTKTTQNSNLNLTNELYEYLYERENNNNGFLNPLYKETIDDLTKDKQQLQNVYNQLNIKLNSKENEIDKLKRDLCIRDDKIDELNLQLSNDINLNAELMRTQNKEYKNVLKTNKDLDLEILKLKSEIAKLKSQQQQQQQQQQPQ